jgi:oligopeptide/dipeptide ABC transporter ATP-binding protein
LSPSPIADSAVQVVAERAALSDATEPLLAVRNLRVEFPTALGDSRVVLRDITFSLLPGEIVGLVGESGAGKTTLARSLLGVPPVPGRLTAGEVFFRGTDLRALSERDLRRMRGKDLSMVVPNPRGELNPLLSVGEQIAAVAQVHLGISRKEARGKALDMLKAVQIPDPHRRFDAYPHQLSGGMAQRVVIAMALVCSPSFVISDDATSGLDVTVQSQILDLIRALAEKQRSAMLFITRDVGITAHFCDRVAVIYAGQIMEVAPRRALFFEPSHPYTIMLLAAFSHSPGLRHRWTVPDVKRRKLEGVAGCSYADRCPLAQERCRMVEPPLAQLGLGHFSKCHFPVVR